MATFVLVHGAWHGSWCWGRVRRALLDRGHDVFTPTLTGIGERSHLLSRDIDLQVHIDDIANLIRWEELDEVILCGHSYGGAVISGGRYFSQPTCHQAPEIYPGMSEMRAARMLRDFFEAMRGKGG